MALREKVKRATGWRKLGCACALGALSIGLVRATQNPDLPPGTPDPNDDPLLYYHGVKDWWTSGLQRNNWEPNLDKINPSDNGSGNWFGLRTKLQNDGLQLGGQYIGTFYGIADGGLQQRTTYDEQLKLFAHLDFDKMLGIPGLSGDISGALSRWPQPQRLCGRLEHF